MLQCVAGCSGVLQCVTVCCSVSQRVAVCCGVLQCVAVCCRLLRFSALQCVEGIDLCHCEHVVRCVAARCMDLRECVHAQREMLVCSMMCTCACVYTYV